MNTYIVVSNDEHCIDEQLCFMSTSKEEAVASLVRIIIEGGCQEADVTGALESIEDDPYDNDFGHRIIEFYCSTGKANKK